MYKQKHKSIMFDEGYDIGLYYFGARYYDASLGRFVSPDPKRWYLNPYSYAGNEPIKDVDFWGLGKDEWGKNMGKLYVGIFYGLSYAYGPVLGPIIGGYAVINNDDIKEAGDKRGRELYDLFHPAPIMKMDEGGGDVTIGAGGGGDDEPYDINNISSYT